MEKIKGYNEAIASEGGGGQDNPVGGFICRITNAKNEPAKEYLMIEFDIMEGEYAGYYGKLFANYGFWGLKTCKSYKEKNMKYFKGFMTAVEQSNQGYKWDWNENTLRDRFIGLVIGEEEYVKNNGSIGKRVYVDRNTSVANIREGEYQVPELKKLTSASPTAPTSDKPDEDLPF